MKIELKEIECKQGAKNLAKILARNVSGDDAKEDPGFKKDLVKIFTKNIQSVEGIVCDEKILKAYEKKGYSEKAARLLVFLTNLYSEIAAQVDGFKNARDVEEFFIKKNAKKDIKSSIIYEIAKAFKIEDEVQEILEQDDYISVEKAGKLAKAKVERRYRLTNDEKIKIEEARVRMLERELDEGLGDIMKLVGKGIKKGAKKVGKIAATPGRAVVKGYKAVSDAANEKVNGFENQAEEWIKKAFGGEYLPKIQANVRKAEFWDLKDLIKNAKKADLKSCLNYIKNNSDIEEKGGFKSIFKTPKLLIVIGSGKAMKIVRLKNGNLNTELYSLTDEDEQLLISGDELEEKLLHDITPNKKNSNTSFFRGSSTYITAFNEKDANKLTSVWKTIFSTGDFKTMNKKDAVQKAIFYLFPPDISELKGKNNSFDDVEDEGEALEDDEEEKKESFIVYKKRIQ